MIRIDEQGRHKYFSTITVDGKKTTSSAHNPTSQAKNHVTDHEEVADGPRATSMSLYFFNSAFLRRSRPSSLRQRLPRVQYLSFACHLEKERLSFWTTW